MPRDLHVDVVTAAQADNAELIHLIQLDFADAPIRLSTGAADITWDGQTWQAIGGALELGGIEESNDPRGQGIDLKLSGVDQTVVSVLLNSKYRGHTGRIWRAYLNPATGTIIGNPVLLLKGVQLSPYTIEEQRGREGSTVRISTRLSSFLGQTRRRAIQTNLISHQHHYNGDTFFTHTASLATAKVYWGTAVPAGTGGGTGGGGSGGGGSGGSGGTETGTEPM